MPIFAVVLPKHLLHYPPFAWCLSIFRSCQSIRLINSEMIKRLSPYVPPYKQTFPNTVQIALQRLTPAARRATLNVTFDIVWHFSAVCCGTWALPHAVCNMLVQSQQQRGDPVCVTALKTNHRSRFWVGQMAQEPVFIYIIRQHTRVTPFFSFLAPHLTHTPLGTAEGTQVQFLNR